MFLALKENKTRKKKKKVGIKDEQKLKKKNNKNRIPSFEVEGNTKG